MEAKESARRLNFGEDNDGPTNDTSTGTDTSVCDHLTTCTASQAVGSLTATLYPHLRGEYRRIGWRSCASLLASALRGDADVEALDLALWLASELDAEGSTLIGDTRTVTVTDAGEVLSIGSAACYFGSVASDA